MYFTMFSEAQESHIYSGDMFLILLFWESTHNDTEVIHGKVCN